jgi:hypothetical protein
VLDICSKHNESDLKGIIVWLPMVPGDKASDAEALKSADPQFVLQGWDEHRAVGKAFARTLHLNRPAWDVYMIYDRGVKWTSDDPPKPAFWMHQLSRKSGADPSLQLVPAKLETELRQRLLAE